MIDRRAALDAILERAEIAGIAISPLCVEAKLSPSAAVRWHQRNSAPNRATLDALRRAMDRVEKRKAKEMGLSGWFKPNTAGYSEPDTSKKAAETIAGRATILQRMVLDRLTVIGPMTADECAAVLSETVLSVRPRLTELLRMGKIADSGIRRKNASGRSAKVWHAL